jgi:hypothetical protein
VINPYAVRVTVLHVEHPARGGRIIKDSTIVSTVERNGRRRNSMATHGMEQVLNQPLSGAEVKECILAKIREVLNGDGRLSDFFAFPTFRFHADIGIVLQNAVEPEINRQVDGGKGPPVDYQGKVETVMVHAEQADMTPNEARVEAELEVPVLTRDEKGREVTRGVKYQKPKKNHPVSSHRK